MERRSGFVYRSNGKCWASYSPRLSELPRTLHKPAWKASAAPVGADRIASRNLTGRKILIVADDHSRPTPVRDFIQPVLAELASAGVRDEDIEILIATGVHRLSKPEEIEKKLGAEVLSRFRPRCHDAYDREGLADLGTTSRGTRVFLNKLLTRADLIGCLGAVEPHLLMGFGGGLKMLIPGCAGAETIGTNHVQGVNRTISTMWECQENTRRCATISRKARLFWAKKSSS